MKTKRNSVHIKLAALQFLQHLVWGSWFVTGGTYMSEILNFSGQEIGMVYGSTAIAASLSPFFIGSLADKYFPSEKVLMLLHFIGGCLLLILPFLDTYILFYPVMLLYLLTYLPTFSLANGLCFYHLEDTKKDFPIIRVWGTIAWIGIGFIISYAQIETSPAMFQIAGISAWATSIFCYFLPSTPPQMNRDTSWWKALKSPKMKALRKDRSFLVLLICVGLICIPSAYYYSFVNLFLLEFGAAYPTAKMSLGQMTEIVIMLLLPWLLMRWKLKHIIWIGLFVWGARYGLFALGQFTHTEYWIWIGLLLHGIAYVCSTLTSQIYLDTRVPAELRNTAQGFFTLLTQGSGVLIGSIVAGNMVQLFAYANGQHDWIKIWLFPCIFGICVSVLFWMTFKSKVTTV